MGRTFQYTDGEKESYTIPLPKNEKEKHMWTQVVALADTVEKDGETRMFYAVLAQKDAVPAESQKDAVNADEEKARKIAERIFGIGKASMVLGATAGAAAIALAAIGPDNLEMGSVSFGDVNGLYFFVIILAIAALATGITGICFV